MPTVFQNALEQLGLWLSAQITAILVGLFTAWFGIGQ